MFRKILIVAFGLMSLSHALGQTKKQDILKSGFVTPADSMQTSVYWYWVSDNISKDGVVKDLEAMKRVGINRAFIGNIGLPENEPKYGSVKILSPQWWDILHTALKTATELDIEIGIFNSPGWSQSGGPWVKSEESMRYIASKEVAITGGKQIELKLPVPEGDFQDLRVIAFPTPMDYATKLTLRNASIAATPAIYQGNNLIDNNTTTWTDCPGKHTFEIKTTTPFTARSIAIHTPAKASVGDCVVEAKGRDGKFVEIAKFVVDRTNFDVTVGFVPLSPTVASFDDIASDHFRLYISSRTPTFAISEIELCGGSLIESFAEKTLAKMYQHPLPYWNEYQWPVQSESRTTKSYIEAKNVVDLTSEVKNGVLKWDAPLGEWIVKRMVMLPTTVTNRPASKEGVGLEIDKMSKTHLKSHFDAFIGEILRRIPAQDRASFKVVVQDSYETGGTNITDTMIDDFKSRYGYDPIPFLAVFDGAVVDSRLISDRFLWDWRRLIADKVAYDYVGGLREISHKNGLTTWLENYGHWGFPGEFLQYGGQSDEVGGEFWSFGELGNIENRAASSCAHIYGKQKVSAESFTCGPDKPYSRYPAEMKQRGDRFFSEGINNTLLHLYIQQPDDRKPGMNAWFGNEFNRNNTWFDDMDLFISYLKRSNYMLQQGVNIADIAYFIGEDTPKMTGVTDPEPPQGYQFDYINAEVIMRDMFVKDGLMTLPHGTQYKVLVLPKQETMRPELLRKIEQLVSDGAIILGNPPKFSPSNQGQPNADEVITYLSTKLWDGVDGLTTKYRKFGKGIIFSGVELDELFSVVGLVKDCRINETTDVLFSHRRTADADIYFLSNQTDKEVVLTPEFRVMAKYPELWDAVTGSVRTLPSFEFSATTTRVPLKLNAFESQFIVFRKECKNRGSDGLDANFPKATLVADLSRGWDVVFKSSSQKKLFFDKLEDWSASSDDFVKHYSGRAVYEKSFRIADKPKGKLHITFQEINCMAKVYVNDRYAGGVWTAPYRVDISDFVKPGNNLVRVEVVNTWVNRLIGDAKLDPSKRTTYVAVNTYTAESQLQKSGLVGSVLIEDVVF